MENNVLDDHLKSGSTEVGLSIEALEFLRQAGKWGKFLAIIGFIGCAIIVMVGLFFGSVMTMLSPMAQQQQAFGAMSGLIGVVYVIIAAIYFFPCLYIYRFSTNAVAAAASKSTENVTAALKNLKSNFKFVGVFMVAVLALYAVVIVFAIFVAAMR